MTPPGQQEHWARCRAVEQIADLALAAWLAQCLPLATVGGSQCVRALSSYTDCEMSTEPFRPSHEDNLELPVEELLRRARPLPPHEEMMIDGLSDEEGAAFLAALEA